MYLFNVDSLIGVAMFLDLLNPHINIFQHEGSLRTKRIRTKCRSQQFSSFAMLDGVSLVRHHKGSGTSGPLVVPFAFQKLLATFGGGTVDVLVAVRC